MATQLKTISGLPTKKGIKQLLAALACGTLMAIGLAVAGLIGIAFVLVPGCLGILAMESGRAVRWFGNAKKQNY